MHSPSSPVPALSLSLPLCVSTYHYRPVRFMLTCACSVPMPSSFSPGQINPSAFNVPNASSCVDLRAPHASDWTSTEVNDPSLIARANAEARGSWVAGRSSVFAGGKTLDEASARLGLRMSATSGAFTLAPPSHDHVAARDDYLSTQHDGAIPDAFDSRTEWGAKCPSVTAVRNQGDCGGCWAFSAVETLADRFCIASNSGTVYSNLTLSAQ